MLNVKQPKRSKTLPRHIKMTSLISRQAMPFCIFSSRRANILWWCVVVVMGKWKFYIFCDYNCEYSRREFEWHWTCIYCWSHTCSNQYIQERPILTYLEISFFWKRAKGRKKKYGWRNKNFLKLFLFTYAINVIFAFKLRNKWIWNGYSFPIPFMVFTSILQSR